MKTVLSALLFFLLATACENCDPGDYYYPACSVDDPTKELEWLREEIEDREQNRDDLYEYFFISQAGYEGETVFIYNDCCPNCNTVVRVLNCSGEQIGVVSPREGDIDRSQLTNVTVVWQPEGFECRL